MGLVAFDTLRLARRLTEAGVPVPQADATAAAIADTIGESVVTRDHLDLRLTELRTELVKWMVGLLLGQTAIISALVKLL
jgi:predicted nucleic acid-binding protein